jgi:ABC-type Na+ efflux pump permease subunit
MNQIKTVFAFTFKDAVRKKTFIISTIITLTIILILSLLPSCCPLPPPTEKQARLRRINLLLH